MKSTIFLCLILAVSLLFSGTIAGAECGDLNDDANIDLDDFSYLTSYMFKGGPPPIGEADMDECGDVDIGDAWYLIQHLWVAGDPPCEGSVTCNNPTGGNTIELGCPIVVYESTGDSVPIPIYLTNPDTIRAASLGFSHDSPDVEITSVSWLGSSTSTEVERDSRIDTANNTVEIYWVSAYDQLRPDTRRLFATMWAQVPMGTAGQVIDFDTTYLGPATEFLLCPVNGGVLSPAYIDCGEIDMIIMTSKPVCGDSNCDGIVNITDAVNLIAYIFASGPAPCDPDGDGVANCMK